MTGTAGLIRTVGLRHLTERRLRTLLTAGGIAAGVALVFSITSMNAALNETIRFTVGAFDGPADLQVTAITTGTVDGSALDRIRAVDGVTTAAPILQARTELDGEPAFVLGATPELLAFSPDDQDQPGTTDLSGAADGIVLAGHLADRLDAAPGDTVTIATTTGDQELPVGVVLPPGPIDRINDGMVAVLPLATAQSMFHRPNQIDIVLIDGSADRTAVQEAVGGGAVVTPPKDAPGSREENVQPFLLLSDAVGMIALFVALVLVFNATSMAMAERRGEVALAAALGARRRQLFLATLGEAAVVGVVGTALGLGLGALVADQLLHSAGDAFRIILPVDPPRGAVLVGPHLVTAAFSGVGVAVLGALLPARRVLRTTPIGALRPAGDYEWQPDDERDKRDERSARRRRLVPIVAGLTFLAGGVGLGTLLDGRPTVSEAVLIVIGILAGITLLLPTALPVVTDRVALLLERGWAVAGRLAGDALRANPRRTSVTLATLILPLSTVVAMGTAFSSAQAAFHRLAETYYGTPLTVVADQFVGYNALVPLPTDAGADVAAVPGVRAALPQHNLYLNTDDGLAIVYAIPEAQAQRAGVPDSLRYEENADDPAAFRAGLANGEVAVSQLAARNRGLDVGDTVVLPTTAGPVGVRVASIFEDLAGVDTFFIDRDLALRFWPDPGATGFIVALDDGADPDVVESALDDAVEASGLPANVQRRDEAVAELEESLSGMFAISRLIQLAAVVVAALSLTSTAFTTVLERRWSLGLQRALGMSRAQIARSLALEAAAVAVIGGLVATVVGMSTGVLLSQSMAIVAGSSMPVTFPWPLIVACAAGALVLSLAATAYPRRLATRTEIIDALVAP